MKLIASILPALLISCSGPETLIFPPSETSGGSGGATSTSGVGGETSGNGGDPGTTAGSSGGSGGTTTTGTPSCPPDEHLCGGGFCFGNTVESGCLQSGDPCLPCMEPEFGTSKCSPAGECDFDCVLNYKKCGSECKKIGSSVGCEESDCSPCLMPPGSNSTFCSSGKCDFSCKSGYVKKTVQGASWCECEKGCCTDLQCGTGKTCNTTYGVCVSATCVEDECNLLCQAQCQAMGNQLGIGTCTSNGCACACL